MITKDTVLKEVLDKKDVLIKFNVPCLTCPMMKMEMDELTIGDICSKYELDLKPAFSPQPEHLGCFLLL